MIVFKPRIQSLPDPQQRLWKEMKGTPADFVLYGGTALALQLGHRQSEDFDFFSSKIFSHDDLIHEISYLQGASIRQLEKNTVTYAVDRGGSIKISFFGGLKLGRVQEPLQAEDTGVQVASMLDIAATKLGVIQARAHSKDYVDIYALLNTGISLPQALAAARAVYGPTFDPVVSLKALTYFDDGNLERVPLHIQEHLAMAVKKVDLKRLPFI